MSGFEIQGPEVMLNALHAIVMPHWLVDTAIESAVAAQSFLRPGEPNVRQGRLERVHQGRRPAPFVTVLACHCGVCGAIPPRTSKWGGGSFQGVELALQTTEGGDASASTRRAAKNRTARDRFGCEKNHSY